MTATAFGLSDVGRRRPKNEDAVLVDPSLGLYAVADGMGGHAAGEVASAIAIETLAKVIGRREQDRAARTVDQAGEHLREAFAEANRKICESVVVHEEHRGMGTTLVALLSLPDEVLIAHVGDSRAYLLRGRKLRRITSDHSWVNEQVKMGLLSDDDAQRHPMRNIVTRALGSRMEVEIELSEQIARPGDVFLLCSDGLNTMIGDDLIEQMLAGNPRNPETTCRALIDAANAKGGEDNVTVVVIAV